MSDRKEAAVKWFNEKKVLQQKMLRHYKSH